MSALFEWMQVMPAGATSGEPHAAARVPNRVFWTVTISLSVLVSYIVVSEQYAWGVVIGIAVAFALLSLVKPQLALLVFLIYIPIENTLGRFGIDLDAMRAVNPETLLMLLYAVIGLPRILIGTTPPSFSRRPILPMLLLSGLMILSIAWNLHVGTERLIDDLAEIKRATFFFLGFILVMATPNKRRYLNLYLVVFLVVCVYLSLDLMWLRMDKAMLAKVESRVVTFKESIVHTSPLVLGLGASFLVALTVVENSSFLPRLLRLSGAGLMVLSSLLLLSRALSAAVIVGVLVTLLASGARKRNLWVLLLALPALWFLLPGDLTARFEGTLFNVQSGAGFTTRRLEVAWPEAIETISEHPLLGTGYGAYKQMAKLVPHNQLLDMWVQIGIGGVILFLWLFTSLVRVAWRARHDDESRVRPIANGLFGQLMGCVIALLFSDSFFYPWLTYALFFTAVLLEPVDRGTLEQKSVPGWRSEMAQSSVQPCG